MRRFFSEAPLFFIVVVIGIAVGFRVAIGWAKSPPAEDPATDPTRARTTGPASEGGRRTPSPVVTAEPRPAATATVPTTLRKKPRPRR